MSKIRSILNKSVYDDERPLNILSGITHESYESSLAKTNAVFYAIHGEHIKKEWNTKFRPLPDNYHILDVNRPNKYPEYIDFDIILSQHKFGAYQVLAPIAQQLSIPLICLEHTDNLKEYWPQEKQEYLKSMQGDINVFISEYSKSRWDFDDVPNTRVIHHGIPTNIFTPDDTVKQNYLLSICNDWIGRDYACGFSKWREVTQGEEKLPVRVRGDTKGLSTPTESLDELLNEYRSAKIFLNTSLLSPIPTVVLEAMSCGLPVISTATGMIPQIIVNGWNGFCSNDTKKLKDWCALLLNEDDACKELGKNARQTIVEQFNEQNFVSNWDQTFKDAMNLRILR